MRLTDDAIKEAVLSSAFSGVLGDFKAVADAQLAACEKEFAAERSRLEACIRELEARVRELEGAEQSQLDCLRKILPVGSNARSIMKKHGYVFCRAPSEAIKDIESLEDGERWEHLAFYLYTTLLELQTMAEQVLEAALAGKEASDARAV